MKYKSIHKIPCCLDCQELFAVSGLYYLHRAAQSLFYSQLLSGEQGRPFQEENGHGWKGRKKPLEKEEGFQWDQRVPQYLLKNLFKMAMTNEGIRYYTKYASCVQLILLPGPHCQEPPVHKGQRETSCPEDRETARDRSSLHWPVCLPSNRPQGDAVLWPHRGSGLSSKVPWEVWLALSMGEPHSHSFLSFR